VEVERKLKCADVKNVEGQEMNRLKNLEGK
jgi:hypothetical protein